MRNQLNNNSDVTSLTLSGEDFLELASFFVARHSQDRLQDVGVGAAHATHCDEHVIVEEAVRQLLNVLLESRTEHQHLTLPWRWHAELGCNLKKMSHFTYNFKRRQVLSYFFDLRLEAHVQHPISFVQHEILDVTQCYLFKDTDFVKYILILM